MNLRPVGYEPTAPPSELSRNIKKNERFCPWSVRISLIALDRLSDKASLPKRRMIWNDVSLVLYKLLDFFVFLVFKLRRYEILSNAIT